MEQQQQQPKKSSKLKPYVQIKPGTDVYTLLEQLGWVGRTIYVPKYWKAGLRKIPKSDLTAKAMGKKYRSSEVLSRWSYHPQEWVYLVQKGFAGKFLYALPKQTKRGTPWYLYV
jgi:hypothetical protein